MKISSQVLNQIHTGDDVTHVSLDSHEINQCVKELEEVGRYSCDMMMRLISCSL